MAAHLIRKLTPKVPIWLIKLMGNLWFPYLGSGVRVVEAHDDYRYIKVILKYSWYNRNYVGTQFGGSIYSMTDPFYMIMLLANLGSDYIVWDKGATVQFIKPGRTQLSAEFKLTEQLLNDVKAHVTEPGSKYVFDIPVEVKDIHGEIVALVNKTLYVKHKDKN